MCTGILENFEGLLSQNSNQHLPPSPLKPNLQPLKLPKIQFPRYKDLSLFYLFVYIIFIEFTLYIATYVLNANEPAQVFW